MHDKNIYQFISKSILELNDLAANSTDVLLAKFLKNQIILFQKTKVKLPSSKTTLLKKFFDNLLQAQICDLSYSTKGSIIWMPYGFRYYNLIKNYITSTLNSSSYDEYLFPNLLTQENFEILNNEINDFRAGIFQLFNDGNATNLYLKPTGESIIYPIIRDWIKKGVLNPPVKLFQSAPYFRNKRNSNPFMNPIESSLMIEGHGIFISKQNMEDEYNKSRDLCHLWLNSLCLAPFDVERPKFGNFPVSLSTSGFDIIMPWGKTYQTVVAYLQSKIFSEKFGIVAYNEKGKPQNTYQITFGFTERTMLTTLLLHMDCFGFRLPSKFSPIQVGIIICCDSSKRENIESFIEVLFNYSTYRYKLFYYDDEMIFRKLLLKGIPILLMVTESFLSTKEVKVFSRASYSIHNILKNNLISFLDTELLLNDKLLLDNQEKSKNQSLNKISHISEISIEKNEIYELNIHRKCVKGMNEWYAGGEIIGFIRNNEFSSSCIVCGKKGVDTAILSKRA